MTSPYPLSASSPVSEATTRRRAPRGQGGELRGEVLAAAMTLLAEPDGEDAMSLRAVAQRVGVSVPSIYLHFADKQALLDAVCEEVFAALDAAMQAAAAGASNVFDGLRLQGIAYVEFARANPEHYRIVMLRKHAYTAEQYADLVMASGAFQHFVASVRDCVDAGVFVGEPDQLALHLWSAAHGLASLLVVKPYFPWPPLDQLIDDTISMAGLGLAAHARLVGGGPDQSLPSLVARLDRLRP